MDTQPEPYGPSQFVAAKDAQIVPGEPPPRPEDDGARYPGHWAHPKIQWVDAQTGSLASEFNGRMFVRLGVRMIEPERSNHNKFLRVWSYQPGQHHIFDLESNSWRKVGDSPNHSAIVRIPQHEVWLYSYRFCPDDWNTIGPGSPLVLYVQNFHLDGNQFISEGHTPPNNNNVMDIDKRIEFPFPNGQPAFQFKYG